MLVKVDNVWTRVYCSKKRLRVLYNYFSVEDSKRFQDPRYRSGMWSGKHRFFSKKTGKLLTGLYPRLQALAEEQGWKYNLEDLRTPYKRVTPVVKLPNYDLTAYPYDYQSKAVELSLLKGHGILNLATNAGKTIVASAIIKSLGLPTLFLVGSKDLLHQSIGVFRETLDCDVGVYGDGRKILQDVTVATVQTLQRYRIPVLRKLLSRFEVLFGDEIHHGASTTWYKVARACNAQYRFGLSGTPYGDEEHKDMRLEGITGPEIIRITNKELIDRGVSAVPKVIFVESDEPKTPGDWHSSYNEGLVNGAERNKQISRIASEHAYKRETVLILAPRRMQCDNITMLMEEYFTGDFPLFQNDGTVPMFSRRENLEEFKRKGGVMIATTIYDEGIDIPQVNVLILAGGMKGERKLLQRIGRSLRAKKKENVVTIYDFLDSHNSYLRSHSLNRLKACIAEEFNVVGKTDTVNNWINRTKNTVRKTKLVGKRIQKRNKPKDQRTRGWTVGRDSIRRRFKELMLS